MNNTYNNKNNSNQPMLPIAPEPPQNKPIPPFNGGYPVPPIAPEPPQNKPVYPGPSYPVPPIIIVPGRPVYPGKPKTCDVRILHAAAGEGAVRVSIANVNFDETISYGNISSYEQVPDGFRIVTITSAKLPCTLLLRKTVAFKDGDMVTLCIINTARGIDVLQLSDMPCANKPKDASCFRVCNLSYNCPPLDVLLTDGRIIFESVAFKEATQFKRIKEGRYGFIFVESLAYDNGGVDIESANIVDPEEYNELTPLLATYVTIKPKSVYTLYVIGNYYGSPSLQTLLVENT